MSIRTFNAFVSSCRVARAIAVVGLLLVLAFVANAAEVPFDSETVIADAGVGAPRSAVIADLDRDGANDALYIFDDAGTSDRGIAWNENRPTSVGPDPLVRWLIDDDVPGAFKVLAADLDGDSDLDVLVGQSSGSRSTAIYENPSEASIPQDYWDRYTVSLIGAGAETLAIADVDGDGDNDIIGLVSTFPSVYGWFENQSTLGIGLGTNWSFVSHTIETAGWNEAIAADVDRDGDVDIVVIDPGTGAGLFWFDNANGDGSSWTKRTIATISASSPAMVAVGDFDGDGDADAVVANQFEELDWYANPGPGGYASAWSSTSVVDTSGTVPDGLSDLHAADVDRDGDVDVLSSSSSDDRVAWYENSAGNGSAWTTRDIDSGAVTAISLATGDCDEDGDVDVMATYFGDGGTTSKVVWYDNYTIHRSGAYPQKQSVTGAADGAASVFAADMDKDGDLDVLAASSNDHDVSWFENDGTPGGLGDWTEHSIDSNALGAASVVVSDVNGDGNPDPVVAATHEDLLVWYANNGSGTSFTQNAISSTINGPNDAVAADIDGDGDVDAVSSSFDPTFGVAHRVQWWENVGGAGTSWSSTTISTADYPQGVWVDDLDGDGDADVLSVTAAEGVIGNPGTLFWHENTNRDGSAWTSHTIDSVNLSYSVVTADVDRDGDADVVMHEGTALIAQPDFVRWYENTAGDGSAWSPHTIATPNVTGAISAADLDLDGDVDVVARSEFLAQSWYENLDGVGGSWSAHPIEAVLDAPIATHVADIDGDGDPEILSAAYNGDRIEWFENRGGQFALPTTGTAESAMVDGAQEEFLKIVGQHAGRSGDDHVELSNFHLRFEDDTGALLSASEAVALVDDVSVYADTDSSGDWTGSDFQINTVGPAFLTTADGFVTFVSGMDVAQGLDVTMFVVLDLAPDASSQPTNIFQLRHVTESTSKAEHDGLGIPLGLEFHANTSSGVVEVPEPAAALGLLAGAALLAALDRRRRPGR